MARFTFNQGNLRKLASLPLFALTAPVRWLTPRSMDRWVIGCGSGIGEGALEIYREIEQRFPEHSLVWLTHGAEHRREARNLGIRTLSRNSFRGWWYTVRAGTCVVTHGFGDVNRYGVMGSYLVQLWHGIPLKKLHLDSPVTTQLRLPWPFQRIITGLYGRSTRSISLLTTASPLAATRMRSAFRLAPEQVTITGDPRNDVLFYADAATRRNRARKTIEKVLGLTLGQESLVLYAPTWRDGDPDPVSPSDREWDQLALLAEKHNLRILVRSHPLGEGDYRRGTQRSSRVHLLGAEVLSHITPVLPAYDTVITDYSSIACDFSLTGGAILWFAPDLVSYERSRGFYEPYRLTSEGSYSRDWNGLCEQLDTLYSHANAWEAACARSKRLAYRYFSFEDALSARRVLDEVLTRRAASVLPNLTATPLPPSKPVTKPQARDNNRVAADERSAFVSPVETQVLSITPSSRDEPPAIIVRGTSATGLVPRSLVLTGQQADLPGSITALEPFDGDRITWQARIELLTSSPTTISAQVIRDKNSPSKMLPPPSGEYGLLALGDESGPSPVDTTLTWVGIDAKPDTLVSVGEWCSVTCTPAPNAAVVISIGPPVFPDELLETVQTQREARYRSRPISVEDAVFFESFYGRVATCNPAAIDRELAQRAPHITRYWSVRDLSVAIPEGAIALVEGSEEWWRVRASARLLVVNDWLRKRWKPRPHQTVMQTWHGTMLKRLALDRSHVGPRQAVAIIRESRRWDILLSQNEHSTRVFRRSYRFRGAIWQIGYPRNDSLVTRDGEEARHSLGIPLKSRVVLYAPTWRDGSAELVDTIGLAEMSRELGEEWTILVRGHSRTHEYGRYEGDRRIIDVSRYPGLDDLILASDIVVTDYSSVMFDASVARKPLVFYVPDLAHYKSDERGFTFDFESRAPGPLTRTREELLAAIRSPEQWYPEYAKRYESWRREFNPYDDGHAAERVVTRLLDDGYLPYPPTLSKSGSVG
ncbi:CDP-glycerol glycerophosphotransferase family protein [Lysinibacter sp. HNR]|uniref:CDP-glycerol glycerophosphotransferase family protein n=1 Tax=Lysinibacter sp. HNR TaxID=3031408 RepID=UPI002435FB47|nr:CDP-glycerol glycerophosphotransferase family protein [Lysinibacter sp. HNR]WGD38310.1 CDP-glycerol glycerophosphotransferase family protein [Lysinibacter sp. HNR]